MMAAQSDPLVVEIEDLELPSNCTGKSELSDRMDGFPLEKEPVVEGSEGEFRGERGQLRAILDLYQRALEDLKAFALDKSIHKHFDMSDGDKIYDRLETKIASPDFLEKLGHEASVQAQGNVQDEQNSWDLITERDLVTGDIKDSRNCLDPESYVLVNQEDIVEGMACFMARYITSLPQTKQLTPKQLQSVLKKAFGVPKKGRFWKLWTSSKAFYTAASWGATAVGLYNNPALVQAASSAFWTSIHVVTKYV